jgi:TRAP-type mannitol/chloroaromatic compound transport system permease small subunit
VLLHLWYSIPFAVNSIRSGEYSTNAGGLIIWPAKTLILLGFILLALQGVSELIKRIAIIRGDLQEADEMGGHGPAAEVKHIIEAVAVPDRKS